MAEGIGVARARQHVTQAEQLVTQQRRLIEELVRDGHSAQAEMARRVLLTLEDSFRLAREHLAREEEKAATQ